MFFSIFSPAVLLGLLIGLPLIPVLIHLINMMRHRRVKWAAMDFLLQSYKKHRNWIWLKQLLLLLLRMAAVALIVVMLAGLGCRNDLAGWLGGTPTHHYVLLDDSYSMSDRAGGTTAFESALQAIGRIVDRAALQETRQEFTLLRFSQAVGNAASDAEAAADQVADLNAEVIDANFKLLLEEKRNTFDVSQLAVGPRAALNVVRQLIEQNPDEKHVVYVVSDFRAKDWDNPTEVRETMRKLRASRADIQLIGCARAEHPNLGIVDVAATDDTRAAGVPLFINVTVKNFGMEAAKKVQLNVRSQFYDPEKTAASEPDRVKADAEVLPTVLIDEIRPGETATRRVQVYFPKAGQHVVEAILPEDSVATDNHRWSVVDFPEGEPVLVIDGSPQQRNAYFLRSAFEPGQRANTGVRPDVQTSAFLRDTSLEVLNKYHSIYLLDVDRLDTRGVENLEAYVRAGGGVGIFAGANLNIAFYNDNLYRDGEGLMPLPLERDDLLPPELAENIPDIEVTDHPVFSVFLGERNPLIRYVTIERYLMPPKNWSPSPESKVDVIARLRNRMPLVVERKFGEGRVVAVLTTLAPDWNNWGHDPSFVVVALKLQSYLASARRVDVPRLVGTPLDLQLDVDKFRKDVTFVVPGETPEARVVIDKPAVKPEDDSPVMNASLGRAAEESGRVRETDRSGVYEAWPIKTDGTVDIRRYAVNVEPTEGDLAITAPQLLISKLDPVAPQFVFWDEYVIDPMKEAGFQWSQWILYLMIFLLIGEQLLAYSASYHPVKGGAR
jgi:hypothetical protein